MNTSFSVGLFENTQCTGGTSLSALFAVFANGNALTVTEFRLDLGTETSAHKPQQSFAGNFFTHTHT